MSNGENSIKGNIFEVVPEWADEVRRSMECIFQWFVPRTNNQPLLANSLVFANQWATASVRVVWQRGGLSLLAVGISLAHYGLTPGWQVLYETLFYHKIARRNRIVGNSYPLFSVMVKYNRK